jgi:F-type H+-transporting ATPase subunit delta
MMDSGKLTTIARPYAAAAFEYALAGKALSQWENFLTAAASITTNDAVIQLLASPDTTEKTLSDLYCGVLAKELTVEQKNFILLLAENGRLPAMPAISALFAEARAEHEKTLKVEVTSAAALTEDYQQKLVTALTKRLQRQVELQCSVDPSLLGGVLIRAGDTVIDGSIRGKLTRLNEFL